MATLFLRQKAHHFGDGLNLSSTGRIPKISPLFYIISRLAVWICAVLPAYSSQLSIVLHPDSHLTQTSSYSKDWFTPHIPSVLITYFSQFFLYFPSSLGQCMRACCVICSKDLLPVQPSLALWYDVSVHICVYSCAMTVRGFTLSCLCLFTKGSVSVWLVGGSECWQMSSQTLNLSWRCLIRLLRSFNFHPWISLLMVECRSFSMFFLNWHCTLLMVNQLQSLCQWLITERHSLQLPIIWGYSLKHTMRPEFTDTLNGSLSSGICFLTALTTFYSTTCKSLMLCP